MLFSVSARARCMARAGILRNRLALRLVEIAGFDRKDPARRLDDRCPAKMRGDAGHIQRRRHDQNFEIAAQGPLHVECECEAEIAVERAFVEFVEDDEARALEFGIVLQAPRQDALGHHLDAGLGRDLAVETHRVTDGLADLLAQGFRHAVRRRPCRKPARLEHDDLLALEPWRIEKLQRHARRLAGTRLGDEQCRRATRQRLAQLRNNGIDGKFHAAPV